MRLVVGSTNPVKRDATRAAAARCGWSDATVDPVAVDSGVPEQPVGREETERGAKTRARRALETAPDADYGVGVEGGVAPHDGGLLLVMWAAVSDGTETAAAAGPSLPLPGDVAERVRAGEELGPVMDDVVGQDDVARNQGAVGVFTDDAMDREDALAAAVVGAFGPFLTQWYGE